jgi:hypothetical protein
MSTMQNALNSGSMEAISSQDWNMIWLHPNQRNTIKISKSQSHVFGAGIARFGGRYTPIHFMPEFITLLGSATITRNTGEQWDIYAFRVSPALFRTCRDTVISFQIQEPMKAHSGHQNGGSHPWSGGHSGNQWHGHHSTWDNWFGPTQVIAVVPTPPTFIDTSSNTGNMIRLFVHPVQC